MEQDNVTQNSSEQNNVEQSTEALAQKNQAIANRKPLYIYLGITIAVLVIVFFTVYFLHKTAKIPVQNTVSQSKPTVTPTMSYANWSRTNLDTFSIETPIGSDSTVNPFYGGGGFMLTVVPPNSPDYPNQPIFDVEAYDSAQDISQKQILYLAEGAKKSTLDVNNMHLPELFGSYKKRMINSKPVYTPTQLRLTYLVLPNALYVFRMYYSSSVSVPANESLYKQFISSFELYK